MSKNWVQQKRTAFLRLGGHREAGIGDNKRHRPFGFSSILRMEADLRGGGYENDNDDVNVDERLMSEFFPFLFVKA